LALSLLLTLAVKHVVQHLFLEPPLAANLDAGYLAFLGKPIERPLLDVEVFRGTSDVEYHIHQATSWVSICKGMCFLHSITNVYSAISGLSLARFAHVIRTVAETIPKLPGFDH
jgi:hypothetical protein